MHRHRIVAQTSLILSILNLVLAAPIVVQGIHEARSNEVVVTDDVATKRKERYLSESEASPSGSTPPPSNLDADGSTSSGYPTPHLSSGSSDSGNSWLLERPPRLDLPASLIKSTPPHPSSSRPSGLPLPEAPETPQSPDLPVSLSESGLSYLSSSGTSGSSEIQLTRWLQESVPGWSPSRQFLPFLHQFSPERITEPPPTPAMVPGAPQSPPLPPWWHDLPPEILLWSSPSSTGSSDPPSEIPSSSQHSGPGQTTTASESVTETDSSPTNRFTPSRHPSSSSSSSDGSADESVPTQYSSASDGSLSSHYFSALDEDKTVPLIPERLVQLNQLTSDGSPPSPPSPPTETSPDKTELFDKTLMKKIGIVAGVVITGGTIAGIVGSQIKHLEHRDRSDIQRASAKNGEVR